LKGATISAAVVLMVFGMKAFDFLYSLSGGIPAAERRRYLSDEDGS